MTANKAPTTESVSPKASPKQSFWKLFSNSQEQKVSAPASPKSASQSQQSTVDYTVMKVHQLETLSKAMRAACENARVVQHRLALSKDNNGYHEAEAKADQLSKEWSNVDSALEVRRAEQAQQSLSPSATVTSSSCPPSPPGGPTARPGPR